MQKWIKHLLNILYPRCCPVCHRILSDQDLLICEKCAGELAPYGGPRCMKCGKPVKAEEEYCPECLGRKRFFTQGFGIFLYDGRMRASLVKYKYYGRREYGDFYAAAMCRYGEKKILCWQPDLILPVPLHPSKQRMRGFNQAEYLAERIGRFYGIPVSSQILFKKHKTKSQKKLSASERHKNLQGAFYTEEQLLGLTILVVDDVYTTGSTADAVAAVLLAAGAEKVYFITVCMGRS